MLAKRLLGQLSASDDYEESMISKLKVNNSSEYHILFVLFFQQACGFEYTSKLQRMFQDIGVSKTLIMEYEKYCENQQVTGIGMINLQNIIHKSSSDLF
jgi:ribonucleotide reductase beta subunit family protein with ferritin-like domain